MSPIFGSLGSGSIRGFGRIFKGAGLFGNTEVLLSTPGNGSWVKPAGVTSVQVECWGGGGAGGGAAASKSAGAGGASGQYAKKIITYGSAEQTISYTVGASTTGTTGAGATGNDTTWNTNVVVAKGGAGGLAGVGSSSTGDTLGSSVGGIGDLVITGENGSSGIYTPDFGAGDSVSGGGGAVGPGYFGSEIINNLSGAGGDAFFGVSSGGAVGGNGGNYGAGGGGGCKFTGSNQSGGGGAQGIIRIRY